MLMQNKKSQLLILVGCVATVIILLVTLDFSVRSGREISTSTVRPVSPVVPSRLPPVMSLQANPRNKNKVDSERHGRHFSMQKNWQKFLNMFGPGLVPEFSPDGHLVSARGKPGQGAFAPGFNPEDPEKAIARARQILSFANDLLELHNEWPLENAAARSGSVSTQVFFNETHDGLQVVPVGGVKVDLGSHGELLGLYSEYAPHIRIVNQVALDTEEAKQKVPSFRSASVDGGGKVIWVSGATDGHIAYQFSSGGYEIVIDAETGNVLFTQNRRHN